MESFSIREYAMRMRITSDSAKCWPFQGGGEEGRQLPPIKVPRFRWWAGELAAAVAGSGESEIKQEADVDEQPLSIEPAPTRSPHKVKLKTPKKRSIIEIFASAPQIEGSAAAVGANGGDGSRPDELERADDEENKKKKKKWKKEAVMAWKRKRKIMSRRGLKVEEMRDSKMKKICKPKMISSVHMLQDPIYMKTIGKTSRSIVENRKKFVRVNRLPHKHKILQATNLISRKQDVVKKLPVCSIIKNKKKVTSAIKSRKINNAKATEFIKRCCEKKRHVSFSEKDDILGHRKMDLPQFKSLCKIFSDVLAASSVMNHSNKGNELSAATDRPQLVNPIEKDTDVGVVGSSTDASSSPKNQLSDLHGNISHPTIINSCNSSCSCTEKGSLAVMPDLNHSIETCNDLDCFSPSMANLSATCTYSGDQDFRGSTHKKGSNTLSQTQLEEAGLPKTSEESFMPTSKGSFLPSSNASSSLTTMKIHSPHCSASCQTLFNETTKRQCQPNVDADVNFCHHIPENQPGHCCAPKDMHSNVCYPMGYKTFGGSVFLSNSVSTCKGKCTGEDFIGLPLNSHGELIQTHPRTKFIGSYKNQSIKLGSHDFLSNKHVECSNSVNSLEIMKEKALDAYQRDQLHWCQNQHHPTVEQVNEPTDEKDGLLHSTANKTWLSFHDLRVGNVTHDFFKRGDQRGKYDSDYQLEPAMQPTMRLMGKTVVVGDGNGDCHAEGRSRTDNDVLTGESHSCRVPGSYLLKQPELLTHKPCWSSTGNLHKVSDPPSNFYPTTELEPRFDPRIGKGHLYPTMASYRQNLQQHILLNSAHCIHDQGVSYAALGTPNVQFRYHDHESPQTPLIQTQAELPQWLLHAKQQKKNHHIFSSTYPTPLSQTYGFSETNLISHLLPHYTTMVPFSVNNICPAQTSALNSSQPSFLSVSAARLISEVDNAAYKERDGTHSKFTGFNSTFDGCKFRKRHTDMDDVFTNPAKRSNYNGSADPSSPVVLSPE